MSIESQLKDLILEKYKSVRAFTQVVEIPYSTVDSMLKRGIDGASVVTVLKVCLGLGIDIEGLLEDRIEQKITGLSPSELDIVLSYRQASADDKNIVDSALRKYISAPRLTLVAARDGGLSTADADAINRLGLEMQEDDTDL